MSYTDKNDLYWKLVNKQIQLFKQTSEGIVKFTDAVELLQREITVEYAAAPKVSQLTDIPAVREDFHRTSILYYCLFRHYDRKNEENSAEQSEFYYNKFKRSLTENFDDDVPVRITQVHDPYALK